MSEELVFYGHPMSRARVTRWMLEEVGQPYRAEILQYGTTMKSPEYLAINPMGKVPAINHRGVVVTEGAAICVYLADAFPEAGLAPPQADPLRGTYYRWIFFAAGPVEQVVLGKALGLLAPEEKKGNVGYGTYDDTLNTLETALANGPYILGERFSAADVFVGSTLGWGMGFKVIEPRPAFSAYWERLRERPAAKRAAELDDAALKALQPAGGG
jgi:glutathione S-transferase